jgi:hypothetical protein
MLEEMLSEESADYFIEEMVIKLIKEGVDHREIMVTVAPPSLDLGGATTIASVDCGDGIVKRYLRVKFLENRREQGRLWLKNGYMPSGLSYFLWEKCKALIVCLVLCLFCGCTRSIETNVNTDVYPQDPHIVSKVNLGASFKGSW